jgi:hypothetical protein
MLVDTERCARLPAIPWQEPFSDDFFVRGSPAEVADPSRRGELLVPDERPRLDHGPSRTSCKALSVIDLRQKPKGRCSTNLPVGSAGNPWGDPLCDEIFVHEPLESELVKDHALLDGAVGEIVDMDELSS